MVSPISNPKSRFCPASGESIPVKQCVSERVVEVNCPLSCPFNPFNPDSPKAFDAIVGLGLQGASRWLEKIITPQEWARRIDAMDRRFGPERDLPLISYETQWAMLRMALDGVGYPELKDAFLDTEGGGLRNDARLVFSKLAQSEALLVEVTNVEEGQPFYTVRSIFDNRSFRYVDFGDQEPLAKGALMFGRFLVQDNGIYVIPGVFVGTSDVLPEIMEAVEDYLGVEWEKIPAALGNSLPEVWNICTSIQDDRDGVPVVPLPGDGAESVPEDPCRVSFFLDSGMEDVVEALSRHPFFRKFGSEGLSFEEVTEVLFDIVVLPVSEPPVQAMEDEEDIEPDESEEDKSVRVGSVFVDQDKMTITALNPVEMELLKALVLQIIAVSEDF